MRRTLLRRKKPLRRRSYKQRNEPGRDAWKEPTAGFCQCGCRRFSMHLHRHHVVYEQVVRREGGDPWAPCNAMLLHPDCHAAQHSGYRKVLVAMVPDGAASFAVRLLGEAGAADYFRRRYASEEAA